MGLYRNLNVAVSFNPEPPQGTYVGLRQSHHHLSQRGLNLPVTISKAAIYLKSPSLDKPPASSITVMAHLDTGASMTSIDMGLATKHLMLPATGTSHPHTAGGRITVPTFAIDLGFPNTSLAPFQNLQISSCKLQFDISGNLNDPKNFGILIGRDVMSRWNIVWDGPTSTVFIND